MNIAKLAIVWDAAEDDGTLELVCTLHVRAADEGPPINDGELAQLCMALDQWWNTVGPYSSPLATGGTRAFYPPSLRLARLEAQRVLPTVGDKYVLSGENSAGTALSGTLAGFGQRVVMHPPQVAILINTLTTATGRSDQGRLYLPAPDWTLITPVGESPPDANRAVGLMHSGMVTSAGVYAANLAYWIRWATGTEFDFVWCVYSPLHEAALAVTHFGVHEYFRTQRPRQVYPDTRVLVGLDGEPAS